MTKQNLRNLLQGFRTFRLIDADDPAGDTTVVGALLAERVVNGQPERIIWGLFPSVTSIGGELIEMDVYYFYRDAYGVRGEPLRSYGYQSSESLAGLLADVLEIDEVDVTEDCSDICIDAGLTEQERATVTFFRKAVQEERELFE